MTFKSYMKVFMHGSVRRVQKMYSTSRVSVNVSNITRGVYFYKYIVNNRIESTGKLIKE